MRTKRRKKPRMRSGGNERRKRRRNTNTRKTRRRKSIGRGGMTSRTADEAAITAETGGTKVSSV